MRRLVLAMVGLVVAGLAVVKLAEMTMTRHHAVDPATAMVVTVEAHTKGHTPYSELQMARSLFMICRLEAETTIAADDFDVLAPHTLRFVIRPALDRADQRQLHGCLEDASVDQLQLHVLGVEKISPRVAS